MSGFDFESRIVDIPDFPEPGVTFKDITPLFSDPQALAAVIDEMSAHFADRGITKVVGMEARGFLLAVPLAYKLGCGFVPARKPGKLPREVYSQAYELEYGTNELQMHRDALTPDDRILIADDLVATGGTAVATARLVEQSGASVAGFAFILELAFLNPRRELAHCSEAEVFSLVTVK